MGNVSGKAFRVLGLDERQDRSVVEQDFDGNFRVIATCFFFWPFSLASLTESCSVVWSERSLHPTKVG